MMSNSEIGGFGLSVDDLQTLIAWCNSGKRYYPFGNTPLVSEHLLTLIERLASHAAAIAKGSEPPPRFVLVERSFIDRLRHDLESGNTRSALGHARWIVDHSPLVAPAEAQGVGDE